LYCTAVTAISDQHKAASIATRSHASALQGAAAALCSIHICSAGANLYLSMLCIVAQGCPTTAAAAVIVQPRASSHSVPSPHLYLSMFCMVALVNGRLPSSPSTASMLSTSCFSRACSANKTITKGENVVKSQPSGQLVEDPPLAVWECSSSRRGALASKHSTNSKQGCTERQAPSMHSVAQTKQQLMTGPLCSSPEMQTARYTHAHNQHSPQCVTMHSSHSA
jgi:hypothetical protein